MAQGGGKLSRSAKAPRGGRANRKQSAKLRKGSLVCKPKRAPVATKLNQSRKLTAAITRNIEKEMGQKVQNNGGALSLLKAVAKSSGRDGGKNNPRVAITGKKAAAITRAKKPEKQDRIEGAERPGEPNAREAAPRFNPKRRFKL